MRRTAAAATCCAGGQATDERLQSSQLAQLRASSAALNQSLELARASLDALNLRAPVAGQLTSFSIQVGQSLQRGERLGQIDSAGRNKLRAQVDEFYLGRVAEGQIASAEVGRTPVPHAGQQNLSAGAQRRVRDRPAVPRAPSRPTCSAARPCRSGSPSAPRRRRG